LNKDRSGIVLVCHADGRLRLAVNQWPDSVQNDSSPGRLQLGRWTLLLHRLIAVRNASPFGTADEQAVPHVFQNRQRSPKLRNVSAEPGRYCRSGGCWSSRFSVRNMMHSFGVKSRNTEKNGV
jgi:hypothetical protein